MSGLSLKIPTLYFSVYGTKYEPRATDDLDQFFVYARTIAMTHEAIRFEIEPHDGTHYEFLWAGPLENGCYVLSSLNTGWACNMGPAGSFTVPSYIQEHVGETVNPHTLAVACDLANELRESCNGKRFKDWKTGQLTELNA